MEMSVWACHFYYQINHTWIETVPITAYSKTQILQAIKFQAYLWRDSGFRGLLGVIISRIHNQNRPVEYVNRVKCIWRIYMFKSWMDNNGTFFLIKGIKKELGFSRCSRNSGKQDTSRWFSLDKMQKLDTFE